MKLLISDCLGKMARSIKAQDPASIYKPEDLWGMVLPSLKQLQIHNLASGMKRFTKVHLDQSQGTQRLFEVYLTRDAVVTPRAIERIKMHLDLFHSMKWDAQAIQVFVWAEYVEPEAKNPKTPKAPPGMKNPAVMP
jgi:hypothetical protein